MKKNALLIFVRNPELGKVKTRLAATLGNENALIIYQELLRHTRKITEYLPVRKLLFYADEIQENDNWPKENFERFQQAPGDLGIKMQAAFMGAFALGAKHVILIGSDCYEMTSETILEAFEKLKTHDAVIGPAVDGGYYLIGFSRPNNTVFEDKTWSTNTVFKDTIQDLENYGFSYFSLPFLNDVDEEKDLGILRKLIV